MTAQPPKSFLAILYTKSAPLIIGICSLYIVAIIATAIMYFLPWHFIEKIPAVKRDQLISTGVFSHKVHPLYREWLNHFVAPPNSIRSNHYTMDTYRLYNVLRTEITDENDSKVDELGFSNSTTPHNSRILFVGDSFGVGLSAGSHMAPAAIFHRLTGVPTYNASNPGYGLAQYIALINYFTKQLPQQERFTNRDVVILTYLGNDYLADIMLYEQHIKYEKHPILWIIQLGPLRNWIKYLHFKWIPEATAFEANKIPAGRYSPIWLQCNTPHSLPFALPPLFSSFLDRQMVMSYVAKARPFLEQLKELQNAGLHIKIVIIPIGLQVIFNDIDWGATTKSTPTLVKELPEIYSCMNAMESEVVKMYQQFGFDTLDLTPVLRDMPEHCQFYQPADTHCTALGYEAIVRTIVQQWPNLGQQ